MRQVTTRRFFSFLKLVETVDHQSLPLEHQLVAHANSLRYDSESSFDMTYFLNAKDLNFKSTLEVI